MRLSCPVAARLWARGVVQGVGFRPFIYALAKRHGLAGWVRNTSAGVEIHVEGPDDAVEAFVTALPREAPARSYVAELTRDLAEPEGATALRDPRERGGPRRVPARVAGHRDLRRLPCEVLDPQDRRFQYPFTNCTNCGPRYTLIEGLPYDRERTTMRRFPMCPACRREYEDPLDRRFHAEPTACPVCGPRAQLLMRAADGAPVVQATGTAEDPGAAVHAAAALLRAGAIVAVKGLGGFHLGLRRHRRRRRAAPQRTQAPPAQAAGGDGRRHRRAAPALPRDR